MLVFLFLITFLIIILYSIEKIKFPESFTINSYIDKFDINKVYEFDNFLSNDECNRIILLAEGRLSYSKVICPTGLCKDINHRTSSNAFVKDTADPVCTKITNSVEKILGIPKNHFEDLQIVKYNAGELYKPHWDACVGSKGTCDEFIKSAGQRVATFIIYLNDNFEKGETYFPKRDISFKPVRGKAILFFNLERDNETILDNSLHAGLPPSHGTKWMCNKWIRVKQLTKN